MNNITFEDLSAVVSTYNKSGLDLVRKAYDCAKVYHDGQFRESGEPYIIHPLNVAYILASLHADTDTLCAGLLHDTIEDTVLSLQDIEYEFNCDIAHLVNGVTKIKKLNFNSSEAANNANKRKIITGIMDDVRIIMIKLADRLHNMQTLEYKKSSFKQKENAMETLKIYAPLAYYLGAYQIKSDLEDLSLKYIKPDEYLRIEEERLKIEEINRPLLQEMQGHLKNILALHNIPAEFKPIIKNIYGIYKDLGSGKELYKIHDLLAIRVLVKKLEECYLSLMYVHQEYRPNNEKIRDYIANPKPNKYQSLNTTVFGTDGKLVQVRIRTREMDFVDASGLMAYWFLNNGDSRNIMQQKFKKEFKFYKDLSEIDSMFSEDKDFVEKVESELFSDRVNVYTRSGKTIQLVKGSTIVDFAYHIHSDVGNKMLYALVNGERVPFNYELSDRDWVTIVTSEDAPGPNETWLKYAITSSARRRIKEFGRK